MTRFFIRLRTIILLVCGVGFALVPHRGKKQLNTILVIQPAKLGDMVCTTPMFRAIKDRYPTTKLYVMGNSTNKFLLEGDRYVDTYVSYEQSPLKMVLLLRKLDIDAVCITGPNFEALVASILSQIPLVIVPRIRFGWSPYETISYKILSYFVVTKDHCMGSYAPREYLRLLEPLNIYTEDTRKEIAFSDKSKSSVQDFFVTEGIGKDNPRVIGILPGAGNEIKSWSPEKFAQLMNCITESNPETVFLLLGTEKDICRAETIQSLLHTSVRVVSGLGKFSIDELKACIDRLYMVIGVDTGPIYIAEALGIPTIDIVGPVDEREQPPIGNIHRIVKIDRKNPELYVMNARVYNKKEAQRQSDSITSAMVYEEFKKLQSFLSEKHN